MDVVKEKFEHLIDPGDLTPLKMAIEKTLNPDLTYKEIGNKHMPQDKDKVDVYQSVKVSRQITKIKSKYPEIFAPFRDSAVVNIKEMAEVLTGIAKDKGEKASSRVSAAKSVINTALEIEKMVKDKEISTTSLQTMAFEDKTYEDIINEGIKAIDVDPIPTE